MSDKKSSNIITGALAGTVGIFITKALGLLYASPFQTIVGDEMIFYTNTYQIYDFLLTISLSGIPFAIASLVAKYVAKDDYKTVLNIRKISTIMLTAIGTACFAFVILNSGALVNWLAPNRSVDYQQKYQLCLIIMSFAIVAVPLLSSFRGFYQGLKHIEEYAFSQVLEQLIRIAFLLGFGFLLVYVFHQERIWAVYAAVLSMSVSALGTSIFFVNKDKEVMPELRDLANKQECETITSKELLKEIIWIAVPFFLVGVIDNLGPVINLYYVVRSLIVYGYSPEQADLIYSIMNFNVYKLTAIPLILGTGFVISIVPHLTTSLTKNDTEGLQKNITQVYASSSYLFFPLVTIMIIYASEMYFFMYGNNNLALGSEIMRLQLGLCILSELVYVTSHITLTLKLKKWAVASTSIIVILSLLFTAFSIENYSYYGFYVMNALTYLVFLTIEFSIIKFKFKMNFKDSFLYMLKEAICCIIIVLGAYLFSFIPIKPMEHGRFFTFFYVGVECVIECLGYLVLTYLMKIPQEVFDFSLSKLFKKK